MNRVRHPPLQHPLAPLFDRAVDSFTVSLSPDTTRHYRETARNFLSYLGTDHPEVQRLDQLRREPHILGWMSRLRSQTPALVTATYINRLIALRPVLNELAWTEQFPELAHLIRREDLPRLPQRLPRPLTAEQDELLQQEFLRRNDLGGNVFLLIRHTGMRIGECADQSFDCLRSTAPNQWAIHVPLGKLKTERMVPVDPFVCELVQRLRFFRSLDPLPADGRLLARPSAKDTLFHHFRDYLHQVCHSLGLSTRIVPHQLRHTYATEMLRAGVSFPALDGATKSTTTLTAGNQPGAVDVNPVTNKVYVSNNLSNTVTVIDGATNVTSTVAVGGGPLGVAVNPVTNKIYVANAFSNNITVIDGATNSTTTIAAGPSPSAVAVNPVTNKVYVGSNLGNSSSITVIDGAMNSTTTVTAGITPNALVVNPRTNTIYVANSSSNTLTVIDGATNSTTTMAVGPFPSAVALNPVTNKIYVTNSGSTNVTVIDGATNTTSTVAAGNGPVTSAVNPVTGKIYVANKGGSDVTVITEAQAQTNPLTTAITPLPGNTTTSAAQAFQFNAANSAPPPVTNLYFQFDTFEGPWSQGVVSGSSFTGAASGLSVGTHILYAFATDGEEATSVMSASSPILGGITAYLFDELGISTSTTLTADVNPATFGNTVTFTAIVLSSASGTPSGSVSFFDGSTFLANVPLDSQGHAAFPTPTLSTGVHSITAFYVPSPSAGFAASTSSVLNETINQAASSTALMSSANPATFGQSVTFTATVSSSTTGTPTGVVQFFDGSIQIGTGALNVNGQAVFSTSSLSVGVHSITAKYSGDTNFTGSTSAALSETVQQAATSTVVVSSAATVTVGQQVTFTATVSSTVSATPTGSVAFLDGSTQIGTGMLGANAQATFSTSSLAVGTHSITAKYSGDANFFGSTSTAVVTEMVTVALTTTAVTAAPNIATTGQQVTFTATVSKAAGSTGTPTGTVTFKDGSTALGTGTLNASGVATFATSSLAAGSHSISAAYGGDANFAASTSAALTETINAPLDFVIGAVAGGSTSATVKAGQTAMYALQLSFVGGAATDQLMVTVSCTGAPPKATCSGPASPVTVTQAATATVAISVSTTANALVIPPAPSSRLRIPWNHLPVLWALPMLLVLLWLRRSKQTEARTWAARPAYAASVLLLAMLAGEMSGCGERWLRDPATSAR